MKVFRTFFVAIVLVILILPIAASADGVIFPPPDYWVYETNQKAVIFHDQNVETLVISITFQGDAKDFSWVIPTPSRPEVEKSTDEIFTALEKLTQPEISYPIPLYRERALGMPSTEKGVTVVETKKVEYYDIAVLEADDPDALTKWLKDNNYQFSEEAKYLLNDYINNKWYFTAVKIDTKSLAESVETQLHEGHAVPLKFTFTSSKIVYPLKISGMAEYLKEPLRPWPEPLPYMESGRDVGEGVSSGETVAISNCSSHDECAGLLCPQVVGQDTPCCIGGQCVCGPSDCRKTAAPPYPAPPRPYWRPSVGILLYVFADHKKDLPGFNTEWANWVKSKDIEKLAIESNGEPWIKAKARKYYLTKLSRYMQPSEMTYDLYPRDAADNKPVGVKRWAWPSVFMNVLIFLVMLSIFLIFGLISPCGIIFIICTVLQFFSKLKVVHVLAWIFQSLVFLIKFVLGILLLVSREQFIDWLVTISPYGWHIAYGKSVFIAAITAWILFLLGMAGIMIWQVVHQIKTKK